MRPKINHSWNLTPEQAMLVQERLAALVVAEDRFNGRMSLVGGVDLHYVKNSTEVVAGVVVIARGTGAVVDSAVVSEEVSFPYVPGLFSFREIPPILKALTQLRTLPDVLICDGQGFAHPRRFGLACHLGVLLDLPAIGCGKSRLLGTYEPPGPIRGERVPLVDGDDVVGAVLRTQDGIKPVFISIGHRISLESACDLVLEVAPEYRLPQTTRLADQLVRQFNRASHRIPKNPSEMG